LQYQHERAPQGEQKRSVLVRRLRGSDPSGFLGAFPSQLPLVLSFMQVANPGNNERTGERLPDSLIRKGLRPIHQQTQIRVGAKIRSDFIGTRLLDIKLSGFKGRICGLEFVPNLLPRERLLAKRRHGKQEKCQEGEQLPQM